MHWDMLITQHDASLHNFTSGSSLTEEGSGVVVVVVVGGGQRMEKGRIVGKTREVGHDVTGRMCHCRDFFF